MHAYGLHFLSLHEAVGLLFDSQLPKSTSTPPTHTHANTCNTHLGMPSGEAVEKTGADAAGPMALLA